MRAFFVFVIIFLLAGAFVTYTNNQPPAGCEVTTYHPKAREWDKNYTYVDRWGTIKWTNCRHWATEQDTRGLYK